MTKDLSKSDLDLTGELSTEGSIGDGTLGLSCLDIDDEDLLSVKDGASKLIAHKQLIHDLQLLKIELNQRDVQLNTLKYEYTTKCESLEEKLQDTLHQNHILQTKLNNIVEAHRVEKESSQEAVKKEITQILVKQKELEENNKKFMKNEEEIKKDLRNLDINETDYQILSKRDEDILSIKEYVQIKFYESQRGLKIKLDELIKQNKYLDEAYITKRNEFDQLSKNYEEDKRKLHQTTIDYQKMYFELADTKSLLQQSNFKRDNYDKTKFERDEFERKYSESDANLASINANIQILTKERNDLIRDLSETKQEIKLLKQDKDYLSKQLNEYQNKCHLNDAKLDQLAHQLEDMKKSREEIYEKYINSKEIYKNEYDTKLSQELEKLNSKTQFEFEKLRANTTEFYERENRALKEARDIALRDKERAEVNERELNKKCNDLLNELRLIQINNDTKQNDIRSELKLKIFELDRANLLNEETTNNLKKAILDNEKLTKKIEVIQNEYYALQINKDKQSIEIESELNEAKHKLESYEKLEREMDDVILQAAENADTGDPDKMLMSYGYGANIVTTAKKRIQQNVHLTRRILHLERLNTSLRHELEREREKIKKLNDDLLTNKNLFEQINQPQEYLIHTIQAKEIQIKKQKNAFDVLQKKYENLETEKAALLKTQNEMSNDIERLIRNNEELYEIREELRKKASIIGIQSNNPVKLNSKKGINDAVNALTYDQPEPLLYTKHKEIKRPLPRPRLSPERNSTRPYAIDKTT